MKAFLLYWLSLVIFCTWLIGVPLYAAVRTDNGPVNWGYAFLWLMVLWVLGSSVLCRFRQWAGGER